jgi:hypothetical protein
MLRLGRPGIIGARTAVAAVLSCRPPRKKPTAAGWQQKRRMWLQYWGLGGRRVPVHVVPCLPEAVVCMYVLCYTYVYSQLIPGSPDTRRRRRCVMDEPDPRWRRPSLLGVSLLQIIFPGWVVYDPAGC